MSSQRHARENSVIAADNVTKSLGLRTTGSGHLFDYTPSAQCDSTRPPLRAVQPISSPQKCEALCAAQPNCMAAEYHHPFPRNCSAPEYAASSSVPGQSKCNPTSDASCILYAECLERHRRPYPYRSDVFHRWGPTWPLGATPKAVKWRTNATLVIVSYKASLSFARAVRASNASGESHLSLAGVCLPSTLL